MPQSPEQLPANNEENSAKVTSYLEVFEKAYECAFWADDGLYMQGLTVNLALAVLDAHLAGLTREEIKAAVAMGEAHGFPCDPQLGAIPKVDNPDYWEQIEAEAHQYWRERLRISDDDL